MQKTLTTLAVADRKISKINVCIFLRKGIQYALPKPLQLENKQKKVALLKQGCPSRSISNYDLKGEGTGPVHCCTNFLASDSFNLEANHPRSLGKPLARRHLQPSAEAPMPA
jgi:hypothetical protein